MTYCFYLDLIRQLNRYLGFELNPAISYQSDQCVAFQAIIIIMSCCTNNCLKCYFCVV